MPIYERRAVSSLILSSYRESLVSGFDTAHTIWNGRGCDDVTKRTTLRDSFGEIARRRGPWWRIAFAVTGELDSQRLNVKKGTWLQTDDELRDERKVDRARVLQPSM